MRQLIEGGLDLGLKPRAGGSEKGSRVRPGGWRCMAGSLNPAFFVPMISLIIHHCLRCGFYQQRSSLCTHIAWRGLFPCLVLGREQCLSRRLLIMSSARPVTRGRALPSSCFLQTWHFWAGHLFTTRSAVQMLRGRVHARKKLVVCSSCLEDNCGRVHDGMAETGCGPMECLHSFLGSGSGVLLNPDLKRTTVPGSPALTPCHPWLALASMKEGAPGRAWLCAVVDVGQRRPTDAASLKKRLGALVDRSPRFE